jgi:hypothetical protein
MLSTTGVFGAPTVSVYALIDLYALGQYADGPHTISVHAKDEAGNWGPMTTATLVIDRVAPTFTSLTASPNPTNTTSTNNTTFTLTAVGAADNATSVTTGEWWEGTDPGVGNGTPFTGTSSSTINFVSLGMTPGNHTITARIRDGAHNWSTTRQVVVNIVYPNSVFSDGFESGTFSVWSATGGLPSRRTVTSGSAQAGTYKMQANVIGGSSGYAQDNTPFVDASYHARFYVNPSALTGLGGTARTVFVGLDAAGATVFSVQIRRNSGQDQVSATVSRQGGGGSSTTGWYSISNSGWTPIEISWAGATSASFTLRVNAVNVQTISGINTNAFRLDTVRLGLIGPVGGGLGGSLWFDSFASTRRTAVGP